ncbi:protein SLOW GREEN 1, chloroplastic [Salvia hispanica]|uniref:protein SLOW GREEN 1, chloroplastic n=1 Tax=Salvia hispanica TaxID=49212 RepID=UPI002009943F|nr:protein SLOW GREEN 1, chloroplastic [Salvia hispanica]
MYLQSSAAISAADLENKMAASSLSNFTLSSLNNRPKSPRPAIRSPSSQSLVLTPKSFSLHFAAKFPNSPQSTTSPSVPALFSSPRKKISSFLVAKIATLLLGSLIFAGCVRERPALAEPVQESEVFEEKKDARASDDEGEEMCDRLLQENPSDVDVLKMVVNVKMRRGKSREAVGNVEKLIELQPSEMEWRLLQALCYEMMGDLNEAKSLFKNILNQKPLLLRALHGLAMVMHKNKEGAAVFEMLDRALEVARRENKVNEERNIRILVAQMHLIKGDLEEALRNFQALIDENPRDFRPYLCQGIVYCLLDKKKEADESFETYQSLVPEEFPERGFMDDVVLAARTETKQQLQKDLQR